MYLVIGATGNVGGPIARQLHEQGHGVRAFVRDPSRAGSLSAGIELAVGDLDDPGSVSKAVAGVEAIFLMQVGGGTEQTKTMIAEEAHLMERLNEVFRGRRSVAITDDVENITGMAPATFRDWCQRHADAFR